MSEIERLMPVSYRRLLELQQLVEAYGKGDATVMNQIIGLQEQLSGDCERLDILVRKEPAHRRYNSKYRYDQLMHESRALNTALQKYRNQHSVHERQKTEREELLGKQFTANDNSDTILALDAALSFNDKVSHSNRGVDRMLDTGAQALKQLRDQRSTLGMIKNRMSGIANTLGLSTTVMKLVERRSAHDQYLFYIGCFVTVTIMFLLLYFVL
ncbi:hypothetical protein ACHWQZ_G017291 [Mnemiopsis leidyi]